jgi:D-alanyl-D-alanine carboxypeptidase
MEREEFVRRMNIKAKGMSLQKTSFEDPIGISENNLSNAFEVAQILKLVKKHKTVEDILRMKNYSFVSESNKNHYVRATDELVGTYLKVLGGKTGYTEEARYCFTGSFLVDDDAEIISVVLGAPWMNDRFQDTKALVSWVEDNYNWK